jgi:hypothetical protein
MSLVRFQEHDRIQFTGYDPIELTPELRFWLEKVDLLVLSIKLYQRSHEWVIDQLMRSPSLPPLEAWLFASNRLNKDNGWAIERFDEWSHPATELDFIWQTVLDHLEPHVSLLIRNNGELISIASGRASIKVRTVKSRQLLNPQLKKLSRAFYKVMGKSYNAISNELGICFNSAMKYWQIHLKENSKIDLDELLLDRQATTERLVQKAVRDHHEGKVPIKDVEIAMNLADRYNGLALKIMSTVTQDLPALLEVTVTNVEIEMPPGEEKLIEQVLETVE